MILYTDIGQPGTFKQATKLAGVGESKNRVTFRHLRRGGSSDFRNGFAKEALNALFVEVIPPRQRDAATWLESSNAFSDGCFGIGEVSKTKVTHNGVKRRVAERQVFDVRNMELDTWIRGFCQLDHPGREVDPSIPYAERVCLRRQNSWSGSHIQEIHAGPNPSRV